ncbi:MAG TPA: diacylglycerol kinase family protein [Thermoplasmata archaeon]|nr:diacylglycerol kinase family protein [Thermoplasmata archaeon]
MDADTLFVVNPRSGNGRTRRRWRAHEAYFRTHLKRPFEVRWTERPGHATEIARTAVQSGIRTVVSVGGDGTLNEVVNGYLDGIGRPWEPESRIAVFSLGTGSDFIKTLGETREAEDVARRLNDDHVRAVDAGVCEYAEAGAPRSRYFLNVAEFGSGGAVVDHVNRSTKILGGKMSFLLAILRTMPRYRNTRVGYEADGAPRKDAIVNDFVVANGRFFGGGLIPAPHADLEDGLLDVVIIGDVDFKTVRKNLGPLREGKHLSLPEITHFRARELVVHAGQEMIDLDGEFVGRHPKRFQVLPKAVRLVAGEKGG